MQNWIIEANQAVNLTRQEDPLHTKDSLVFIDLNRHLSVRVHLVDFKTTRTSWQERQPKPTPLAQE